MLQAMQSFILLTIETSAHLAAAADKGSRFDSAGGVLALAQSPLRRGDIPLSAVDFHISSIVEELMQVPSILAAAQSLEAQTDMNDSLRRAMWLFHSGLNSKTVSTGGRLVDSHEKKTLQPLWQAAHAAADAWSADYIWRRFG